MSCEERGMCVSYIKTVLPMKGYRLLMERENGSTVIADLSRKLHTMKYADTADIVFLITATTEGWL